MMLRASMTTKMMVIHTQVGTGDSQ
jgi:hypothetical protein